MEEETRGKECEEIGFKKGMKEGEET